MKARIENGFVALYSALPSKYKSTTLNVAGGFHLLQTAVHEAEGFYNVVNPEYDPDTEELGDVFFDEPNTVFTYPVIAKILPDLATAITLKKRELRNAVKDLYKSIQWYLEMKRNAGETIPQAVKDKLTQVKTQYDILKAEIEALTTVVDVIKYQLPYEQIEILKDQLEAIE